MKSLSSFTKRPNKASHVITDLLKEAHVIIPKEKWNTTLVALKATAGFRSLPVNVSTSILDEVQKTVENSSFSCAEECVSVLSGEDEGIYGWYTLNFLLGAIEKENNSVALLAVGGGSLQLSFSPADTDSISLNTEDYKILPKVHFSPVPIYSRSYLGFGTTSAKLSILEIPSNNSVVSKRKKNSKDLIELSTPCVHPLEKITYRYNSEIYRIRGDRHGKYGYKYCYKKAVDFLGDTVSVPEELRNREIYAVSAHFIDAIASTLLVYEPSGSFTVGEFVSSCRFLCELPLRTFGCLECCYIAALLQHSIGLSSEKEIKFATQISGVSTSWSLGAALNML
ncbi:ectonucleoside triphosphate diphosphohydrolase 6-like isoform X2 [Parasteatoda tepidariorum]|nr:ectonucleoside triphosphate diphosphohydrolase 6-like isoform X2 [Parasteatoda tepidariorum]